MDYRLNILGYVLAVTGSIAFLPTIWKIVKSKSGVGLNLTSFMVLDFVTCLISAFCLKSGLAYSNFAEILVTNVQVFAIHALARYYLNQPTQLAGLVLFKFLYVLLLILLPLSWIKLSMNCLLPLMIFNRGGQVYRHYQDKSTGQLAGATLILQWLQFSGRICTALMSDVAGFLAPMALNWAFGTIIGVQFLWYTYYSRAQKDAKKAE